MRIPLFQQVCVSDAVAKQLPDLALQPYRSYAKSRWIDNTTTPPTVDPDKFLHSLNVGQPKPPPGCPTYQSITPRGFRGHIMLDIETPFWDPFRHPTKHTDAERDRSQLVYLELVSLCRRFRPTTPVSMFQGIFGTETEKWWTTWNTLADNLIPSLYLQSTQKTPELSLEQQWAGDQNRLRTYLTFKAAHPPLRIYPIIQGPWQNLPATQVPLAIAQEHVRRILTFSAVDQTIDGLYLFRLTNARDDDYDLQYLRMLTAEIRHARFLAPATP